MNLILNKWTQKDINNFQKYIYNLKQCEKINWVKNNINTKLPVLAIKSAILRDIAKQILKGNYSSFLNFNLNKYYENTIINAIIISKINNFEEIKYFLFNLSNIVDNWATCDVLSFKINNSNIEHFFYLSKEYISSSLPFKRRIGVRIWFNMLYNSVYFAKILPLLKNFEHETDYYVNMIIAWFLCESFIKHRAETLKFMTTDFKNKFIINKAIQKCRESFRVSKEDKLMLIKYKRK